jgi:hypothetical protein
VAFVITKEKDDHEGLDLNQKNTSKKLLLEFFEQTRKEKKTSSFSCFKSSFGPW